MAINSPCIRVFWIQLRFKNSKDHTLGLSKFLGICWITSITCFIALSGFQCDSLYAVSPSKLCLWQWPQTEFVMQGSQQWGVWILSLFPLPSPCRQSLPQGKLSVKTLPGSVPMIWALFSPTRAPLSSITALLLAVLEKGLECFLHSAAVWLNQSKLPVFLQACSRQEVFTYLFISMVSCQSENLTPNFALLMYKCSHFSYRAIKPLWGWVTWLNLY